MMQRRDFVKTCAGATMSMVVPSAWSLRADVGMPWPASAELLTLRDPRVRELAVQAVDAARTAGASYADVRLTNTITRTFAAGAPIQEVVLGLSVRAVVNGYWGWAATPVVSSAEAVRVARVAVAMATKSATYGKPRQIDLGTILTVHQVEWTTPVKRDPFSVPLSEVADWMHATGWYARDLGVARGDPKAGVNMGLGPGQIGVLMQKQERVFASTEGSLCTQMVIMIQPSVGCTYRGVPIQLPEVSLPVQAGWERIADAHIPAQLQHAMEKVDDALAHALPVKPVEVGRYDLVLTVDAMATLLSKTLGPATELDRALGYEANAGGTSYLGPHPLTLLGTTVASPLVTVTADRSTPLALATIGWDDEGVAPAPFPLISKGVLVDYQTTREQATWLAPWYQKQGLPVRSHGCAGAPSALAVTMQHTPNLQLHPGPDAQDLDNLVVGMEHGLLIEGLGVHMDFQCSSGIATLGATEIRKGKRVAHIRGAGMLFRSSDFWKNVQVLGGPASQHWTGGFGSLKGEPGQDTGYSIAAVPAVVKQQAIIDLTRKA